MKRNKDETVKMSEAFNSHLYRRHRCSYLEANRTNDIQLLKYIFFGFLQETQMWWGLLQSALPLSRFILSQIFSPSDTLQSAFSNADLKIVAWTNKPNAGITGCYQRNLKVCEKCADDNDLYYYDGDIVCFVFFRWIYQWSCN